MNEPPGRIQRSLRKRRPGFPDGTVYPATIHLDVAAQDLAVAVENSGYKKLDG